MAILDRTSHARVLTFHSWLADFLLDEAGFVQNQHSLLIPKLIEDIVTRVITHAIGIPVRGGQKALRCRRRRIAGGFRQLSSILARHRFQKIPQVHQSLSLARDPIKPRP